MPNSFPVAFFCFFIHSFIPLTSFQLVCFVLLIQNLHILDANLSSIKYITSILDIYMNSYIMQRAKFHFFPPYGYTKLFQNYFLQYLFSTSAVPILLYYLCRQIFHSSICLSCYHYHTLLIITL